MHTAGNSSFAVVIDDDPAVRENVCLALNRIGCMTDTYENVAAALVAGACGQASVIVISDMALQAAGSAERKLFSTAFKHIPQVLLLKLSGTASLKPLLRQAAAAIRVAPPGDCAALVAAVSGELLLAVLQADMQSPPAEDARSAGDTDLLKRKRYLECLSGISSQLLSAPDPRQLLPAIVGWLQQASEVSRCYYFDCFQDPEGRWVATQRVEAVSPGVAPLIDDPRMNAVVSGAGGSARVIEELASGNEVEGFLHNLDGIERTIGELRGAYWMLELPVIVDEELAGFIGFDVCEPRTDLGTHEVALLRSAANAISAAFERVKAESKLREAHTLLANILSSTTEFAIIATDLQLRVLHYNPVAEQLFGFTAAEVTGRTLADVDPFDLESTDEYGEIARQVLNGESWESELEIHDPLGRQRIISIVASEMLSQGDEPRGLIVFARDVTQLKQDERRMLEIDRMESVGRLAGGIAHDFNNILMGVLGYASLAKDIVSPKDPVYRMLTTIEQSGERAAVLTSELLAYARGGKFQSLPLRLDEQVDELLNILGTTLPKNVSIVREFPAALPYVIADPAQVQQVIMNLCINAGEAIAEFQKATGQFDYEGELHLRTGTAQLPAIGKVMDSPALITYVLLEVKDNGCGMDEATRQRIFEPFYTTKFTGRGLGLAAVDGIIRNHNGLLTVKSAPSAGATFTVFLPAALDIEVPETEEEIPPLGGLETILVVDDEEVVRQMALLTLTNLGYSVLLAENGREGLDVYREQHKQISLILLDMTMPGKSGELLLQDFLDCNPQARILLTSGYDEATAARNDWYRLAAGFLQKPYTTETLARAVRIVLDKSTEPPEGA